jgi:hypothetical protein
VSVSQELGPVFQYFDRDHSDTIAFEEFMRGVRGALPPQRREVVQQAFNKLDGRRAGVVTVEDVALCFNPRENPDVRNGKKSERQVCGGKGGGRPCLHVCLRLCLHVCLERGEGRCVRWRRLCEV